MLDLPRFAVLYFDEKIEAWGVYGVKATFDEGLELLKRARGKGETSAYLVSLGFIFGPAGELP